MNIEIVNGETDLEEYRETQSKNEYEMLLGIDGVEYVIFVEYFTPDPSVGFSGGPEIHGVFRPTGEDVKGHISEKTMDKFYSALDEIEKEGEETWY